MSGKKLTQERLEAELARWDAAAGEPDLDEEIIPKGLNRRTAELVLDFAKSLAEKLLQSEIKYGWSDGWMESDWKDKCLADFHDHIIKGDPRDVAAYCAFMWHHEWPTAAAQPSTLPPELFMSDAIRMQVSLCFIQGYNQAIADAKALGVKPMRVKLLPPINPLMFNADVMFGYNKARKEGVEVLKAQGIEVDHE